MKDYPTGFDLPGSGTMIKRVLFCLDSPMSEMTMFLTLTEGWSSAHASRKLVRDARWNSSGKTCTN
jgi:hypothetical protein